jgi:GNAT superfamily N-acetyltransferase
VVAAYVAVHDAELVGHVAVSRCGADPCSTNRWRELTGRPVSDLLAVSCLFVRPCQRGKGYGSALLEAAAADIRRRGLLPTIDVVTDTWTAPDLYVDRGWKLRASDPRSDGLWVHRLEGPAHA